MPNFSKHFFFRILITPFVYRSNFTTLILLVGVGIVIYVVYSALTSTRESGTRSGGGGGGSPPDDGPPPPSYGWRPSGPPPPYDQGGGGSSSGKGGSSSSGNPNSASGPGFFTGLGLGALGGYLFGGQNRYRLVFSLYIR